MVSTAEALWRYMTPAWEDEGADLLESLIKEANDEAWPTTRGQWRRVCDRFGLRAFLAHKPMLWEGMVLGCDLIIQEGPDRWKVLVRLCHEVCEALQTLDVHPELRTPGGFGSAHRIARLAEDRYKEFLIFFRAAEEAAQRLREERHRIRAWVAAQPVVYERDEYADPPFVD